MYKIVGTIAVVDEVNARAATYESNPETKYCDLNKDATQNLWAIPIIESYLRAIGYGDEFFTNLVEELPEAWSWAFPERPIRVTIPNSLITRAQVASAAHTGDMLDNLGQIIDAVYPAQADYIVVSEANAIIYLNFILPEHEAVLRSFSEITIEYYQVV